MRRIGPLNIKSLLTVLALVGSMLSLVTAEAPAAFAASDHAYCTGQSNGATTCQQPADQYIYLDVLCDPCDPANQAGSIKGGTRMAARVQKTGEQLIKFTTTTSAGSYSEPSSSLTNCTYSHLCTFDYPGYMTRSDLYSGTPAPQKFTVSAAWTPVVMPLGSTSRLHGSVSPSKPGATVYAQRLYPDGWHTTGSQALNSSSAYSFASRPGVRGVYHYRVIINASGSISAGNSTTQDLYVGVYKVTGSLSPTTMTHGSTTTLSGVVAPARGGQTVYLQRYYSSAWHNVSSRALTSNSSYAFSIRITSAGTYTYRVNKPGDGTYSYGVSPTRSVKVS